MAKRKQNNNVGCLGCLFSPITIIFSFTALIFQLMFGIIKLMFKALLGFVRLITQSRQRKVIFQRHYDDMNGHEFEYFCADILNKNGFKNVNVTKGSGDYGVDILAEKDSVTYAIQCKRYSSNIGNKAVQEIYSGRDFYNRQIGIVMTNRYFTPAAIETAKRNGVILWDREQLEKMIATTHKFKHSLKYDNNPTIKKSKNISKYYLKTKYRRKKLIDVPSINNIERNEAQLSSNSPERIYESAVKSIDSEKAQIGLKEKNKPKELWYDNDWYITISFEKSSSENYDDVLLMAKCSPKYVLDDSNKNIRHSATYSGKSEEFLSAMQLYELVKDWKATKVSINNEYIGIEILNNVLCYAGKCKSSDNDYCFGESVNNRNMFGCKKLKASNLYGGFADCFIQRNGIRYLSKVKVITSIYNDYGYLKYCPAFDCDNAIIKANSLPDKLAWNEYTYKVVESNIENEEISEFNKDSLLKLAIEIAIDTGSVSTALLQTKLSIGYARAARIINTMEKINIIGPFEGSKPRKVLITREEFIEMTANNQALNN